MGNLKAGTGKSKITPHIGAKLIGYSNRPGPSTAVHDDLYARALVLDDGNIQLALCSVEMLWLRQRDVDAVRTSVANPCVLKPKQIFIFPTPTHSRPGPQYPD